jgi:hypothetical protein
MNTFSLGGKRPRRAEQAYLRMGLDQPGYKLPLFDDAGQRIRASTIQTCIDRGWAEPWFSNPLAPDWLVCRLTQVGIAAARTRDAAVDTSDDWDAVSRAAS